MKGVSGIIYKSAEKVIKVLKQHLDLSNPSISIYSIETRQKWQNKRKTMEPENSTWGLPMQMKSFLLKGSLHQCY